MRWVMTGKIAAIIDRPSVLLAPALAEYMVYVCAMLSGRLRQHHHATVRRGPVAASQAGEHTVKRERNVLRKECHRDHRNAKPKDHTCERWDDPMCFGSARPTEDL
jgi:hypothetical protein